MKITLIRHGETDFNVKHLIQGVSDGELNATGIQQAKALGKSIENESFTRIYSSDLRRCQQTLQYALSQLKTSAPDITLDQRLRERNFGEWDGLPTKEILLLAKDKGLNPLKLKPPGGETYEESYRRIASFIDQLMELADDSMEENILVSTHGMILQNLMTYFNNSVQLYNLENFTHDLMKIPMNTARTTLNVGREDADGKRTVSFDCIFDASHLKSQNDSLSDQVTQALKDIPE